MDTPGETDVRCSTIVFRGQELLLIHRYRNGADDWVLPGGTPRPADAQPEPGEPDLEACFVPLAILSELRMRPPLAGYLRALNANGASRTAAYLGNLWRPEVNGMTAALNGLEDAQ